MHNHAAQNGGIHVTTINEATSTVIRIGTMIGIAIMTVGLLLFGTDYGEKILLGGTIVLVFTPLAGIITSLACLLKEGDRKWAMVAVILIAVIAVGLAITMLT